ncbi:hypothetical protein IWQ62_005227 [Dispira parvispora]|uniref:Temperature dependent protein affecting M2 dsRNA replication-domain-containing protein n=1 Tax=Dispira parvispora TaxID=1520584 RepID=A0A9W8DZV3_9FUNG|nr:hypothetical protein IWQ62_005227 [Dispira parvispora]
MPIRNFDVERFLIRTSPLAVLNDVRVGIDGNYWLRRLVQNTLHEAYSVAMGGLPLPLKTAIEQELAQFKTHHIHPFFVFSGVNLTRKDKPFAKEDNRPSRRAAAWQLYENQQREAAERQWMMSGSIYQQDLLNEVFWLLRKHQVEFIRAPYSAWGQLAYLSRHPLAPIHAIVGGLEILCFEVDRVITRLDFDHGTFAWVDKRQVLRELGIDSEQFLDACILAGFDWSTTFPPLLTTGGFVFKALQDILRQYKTGFNAVQQHASNPEVIKANYGDTFCRARCMVKYHLVLNDQGQVVPLSQDKDAVPSDIHEFIGYRLPNQVYQYLARGLVGPQVPNCLVRGFLMETAPLCNGETTEYKHLLNALLPLRTGALALLTKTLHQFYQSRKVVALHYFEPNVEHPMPHNQRTIQPVVADQARVTATQVSYPTVRHCLTEWVGRKVPSYLASDVETGYVTTSEGIISSALLTVLREVGCLEPGTLDPTAKGRALIQALEQPVDQDVQNTDKPTEPGLDPYFSQELVAVLLLLEHRVLKPQDYSIVYDSDKGNPYYVGQGSPHLHINLIARTLSLVPGQFKGSAWNGGPLSRDLLVFNSCARAVVKTVRSLCEMTTLHLLLMDKATLGDHVDYTSVAWGLLYPKDTNDAVGIICKHYLEYAWAAVEKSESADGGKATWDESLRNDVARHIRSKFPAVVDPLKDLQRGFRFWDRVMNLVRSLVKLEVNELVDQELLAAFEQADQWLAKLRQ